MLNGGCEQRRRAPTIDIKLQPLKLCGMQCSMKVATWTALRRRKLINRIERNDYLKEGTGPRIRPTSVLGLGREDVNLANMVRKYHCPPPDSASAVKLFSAAKHVLGQTRLSMKPANVERNLFLKYRLRAMTYGGY